MDVVFPDAEVPPANRAQLLAALRQLEKASGYHYQLTVTQAKQFCTPHIIGSLDDRPIALHNMHAPVQDLEGQ